MAVRKEAQGEALNGGVAAPTPTTIDQVRELLFGESNRGIDQRLTQLDGKLEAKVDALHAEILVRLQQIETRLDELQRDTEERRLTTIDDIGRAITDLGATVRNLSASRKSS
ncbi:MAG: hypothetical protein BGP04_08965 [Rhizobiales bacterium 62-17]|nr:hypothetical protein [Hyphomicrobiales bacterium]OJY05498.1 MAG: hypothetical protein BGP04_08965 [Rhizobiales bacterium 62-17]